MVNGAQCYKDKIWKIYLYSMLNKSVKTSVPLAHLKCNLYKAFFTWQISHEKRLEMLAESKKTRVPGKPRHFIDWYLDELDKVWARHEVSNCFLATAKKRWFPIEICFLTLYLVCLQREEMTARHFLKTSFVLFLWIFTLLGPTQQRTPCSLPSST